MLTVCSDCCSAASGEACNNIAVILHTLLIVLHHQAWQSAPGGLYSYVGMAYTVVVYVGMAYVGMVYLVMAYVVMAFTVMARRLGRVRQEDARRRMDVR